MISNRAETACGLSNVPAVAVKALVSCPECLERVSRWSAARDAARAAWNARISTITTGG
jgi:hypothetical protein